MIVLDDIAGENSLDKYWVKIVLDEAARDVLDETAGEKSLDNSWVKIVLDEPAEAPRAKSAEAGVRRGKSAIFASRPLPTGHGNIQIAIQAQVETRGPRCEEASISIQKSRWSSSSMVVMKSGIMTFNLPFGP